MGRVRSPKRDDNFMVGLSSDHGRIVFILSEAIQRFLADILLRSSWQAQYLVRGEMTLVALRIVNDVSYVTLINHEIHFSWQVQYLAKLEDDSCCSAHCK